MAEYAPRGPVYRDRTGTPDYTDRYEDRCQRFRESLREQAHQVQRLNAELGKVSTYIQAINGQMWSPTRARYKSQFVDNRIAKNRYDDLSQLTDIRPTIDITTSIAAYDDVAKMLDQLVHLEWNRNNIDLSLVTAADICKAYGTAFWKMGAAKPGITKITPCGPDQVLPIQPGFDIQDSAGVLYKTWKTAAFMKRKFPYCSAKIEQEADRAPMYGQGAGDSTYLRPAHIDQFVWNALNPGMQRILGSKAPMPPEPVSTLLNALEVEEYWIDDPTDNESLNEVIVRDPYLNMDAHNWWYKVAKGKPLYPRKRVMTFVGRRIIYDGPSPFWHGLYPFPTLRLNPVFFSFWGLSKYRDLIPVNMAINEIVAGVLDLIKRVLNPTSVTRDGAVAPAAWKEFFPDMPGMKLKVMANANPKESVHYMEAPVIPDYVARMLAEWLGPEYDRLSGTIDIMAMSKKAQVPGGDTIDQMRDAMSTGLKMEGRQIEIFLRDAGRQAISNFLQFYTPAQLLKLLGEAGITSTTFVGNVDSMIPGPEATRPEFFKNIALNITPGSLHVGKHDRDKTIAISLAQSGLISRRELFRKLDLPNGPQILQELAEENTPHPNQDPNDPNSEPIVPEASGRNARMTRSSRNGSPV